MPHKPQLVSVGVFSNLTPLLSVWPPCVKQIYSSSKGASSQFRFSGPFNNLDPTPSTRAARQRMMSNERPFCRRLDKQTTRNQSRTQGGSSAHRIEDFESKTLMG